MPAIRVSQLAALPNWQWDLKSEEVSIETKLAALENYVNEHGQLPTIKNRTKIEWDGNSLTDFVGTLRALKRQGNLDPTDISRLESIPGWDWTPANQSSWENAFQILQKYLAREKHTNVPQSHIEDGFALGVWVANQRKSRRDALKRTPAKRRIDPERFDLLSSLPGWAWDRNEAAFKSNVYALQVFYERERHYRIPHTHVENGIGIGSDTIPNKSNISNEELLHSFQNPKKKG